MKLRSNLAKVWQIALISVASAILLVAVPDQAAGIKLNGPVTSGGNVSAFAMSPDGNGLSTWRIRRLSVGSSSTGLPSRAARPSSSMGCWPVAAASRSFASVPTARRSCTRPSGYGGRIRAVQGTVGRRSHDQAQRRTRRGRRRAVRLSDQPGQQPGRVSSRSGHRRCEGALQRPADRRRADQAQHPPRQPAQRPIGVPDQSEQPACGVPRRPGHRGRARAVQRAADRRQPADKAQRVARDQWRCGGRLSHQRDSARVVYRADRFTNDVIELFSVPLAGGASIKLNGTLPAGAPSAVPDQLRRRPGRVPRRSGRPGRLRAVQGVDPGRGRDKTQSAAGGERRRAARIRVQRGKHVGHLPGRPGVGRCDRALPGATGRRGRHQAQWTAGHGRRRSDRSAGQLRQQLGDIPCQPGHGSGDRAVQGTPGRWHGDQAQRRLARRRKRPELPDQS